MTLARILPPHLQHRFDSLASTVPDSEDVDPEADVATRQGAGFSARFATGDAVSLWPSWRKPRGFGRGCKLHQKQTLVVENWGFRGTCSDNAL